MRATHDLPAPEVAPEAGGKNCWPAAYLLPAVIAAAVGLGLVVVSQRHGLDWTDESFVWTMIASDRVAVGEPWGFHHLLHPVWVLVGESVLGMRLLRVAGYVLVSVALTAAAVRVLRHCGVALSGRERWLVLLVAQAGTLLAFSYPPRYLGYNELSAWLSALVLAVVAVGLLPRASETGRERTALPWLAAGVLVPVLVAAKFTSGAAWAVLVLLAVVVPVTGVRRWLRLVAVVGGAAVSTAAMSLAGVPVARVVRDAVDLLGDSSAQQESNHGMGDVLQTYLTSTVTTGRAVLVPLLLLLAVALVCTRWARSREMATHGGLGGDEGAHTVGSVGMGGGGSVGMGGGGSVGRGVVRGVVGVVLAVGFAAVLLPAAVGGAWEGLGGLTAAMGVGALLMTLVTPRPRTAVATGPRTPVLRLLTLATPLLAAVGTNNEIWSHTVFSATPWAVLLGVALCLTARAAPRPARAAPLLLAGLTVALAAAAVHADVTRHPYRSTDYLAQRTPTAVPQLRGVLLTEEQASTADWLQGVAAEQDAGAVPAVALYLPGYLLAFNASGWASPWRGGSWQSSVVSACEQGAPDDLFVLEPAEPATPVAGERARLQEALLTCGFAFPDDFERVAEHEGSVVWRVDP